MSDAQFGVLPTGFLPKTQQQIIADLNTALAQSFGASVNVAPDSNLGVLVGVFSEPLALLWQAAEAVYWSAFYAGAEGLAVDNQLAIIGLRREAASPTVTNPATSLSDTGITLHGLVLGGVVGLTIPSGSTLLTTDATPYTFTLDAPVTIQPAVNAVQQLVLSRIPASGSLALTLTDSFGTALTTNPVFAPLTAPGLQNVINNLVSLDGSLPFTDVTVTSLGSSFSLNFGASTGSSSSGTVSVHVPTVPSGARAQPQGAIAQNTLVTAGNIEVNAAIIVVTQGAPARGIGSATCSVNGPIAVPAGNLSVIGSPLTGWTSVNNELDCVLGANAETDAEAMIRFAQSLQSSGLATLGAIAAKVAAVDGVTAVRPFENRTNCAVQALTFTADAPTDTYQLQMPLGLTASLPVTATAAQVQEAINAVSNQYNVLVNGNNTYGMSVDFNGSLGGQAQPLMGVVNGTNNTGIVSASFGRPPHSYEIVVEGGDPTAIAQAIQATADAGIGAYGAPAAITTGSIAAGSSTLSVASTASIAAGQTVTGPGLLLGTIVQSVGNSIMLNQPASVSQSQQTYIFTTSVTLQDSQGNTQNFAFSRPVEVLPYIAASLLTDYYNVPGNSSSGINPKASFSPSAIATIQQELVTLGESVPLGGLIVGQGSNGLVGAFNNVPGILSYSLAIQLGSQPTMPDANNPTVPGNIQLLANQAAIFEAINIEVQWS